MAKRSVFVLLIMASSPVMQALRPLSLRSTRGTVRGIASPVRRSSQPRHLPKTILAGSAASVALFSIKSTFSRTSCAPASFSEFPADFLQYDHYNGVTVTLTDSFAMDVDEFADTLQNSLREWRTSGRKGIWIQVAPSQSDKIHACIQQGFDYHMVVRNRQSSSGGSVSQEEGDVPTNTEEQATALQQQNNFLVLTQWLPPGIPNRLPPGPTHQVGVGCLIFHPNDWNMANNTSIPPDQRRMLVVQEQSGPAAAWKLWKMPTGLADAGEDVHDAAIRECKEETGLDATFCGMLAMRQAHAQPPPVAGHNKTVVMRAHSDLFCICILQLQVDQGAECSQSLDDLSTLETCPDEIAAIQWMTVSEYCAQERWQSSPIYLELNRAVLNASRQTLFDAVTLPLGFSANASATNTLYKSALLE